MATNITYDSSRDLRHTRLILLSTLFLVGLTGCSIVIYWLIRYARWNMRSARICSLILNLVIANLSVYMFATGSQIYWEFQPDRQWPFNDFLCMEKLNIFFSYNYRNIKYSRSSNKIFSKFFYSFFILYCCYYGNRSLYCNCYSTKSWKNSCKF